VKVAHLADLHLGFRQYHRQTPSGHNQREADVGQMFRRAIDQVIEARPGAVLIAGDLFHSVRPTNPAILFAFREFTRLRAALPQAPMVVVAGNHDTPRTVETGWILSLLSDLGIDVATDVSRRLVYPELDLSILAVPYAATLTRGEERWKPEGPEKYQVLLIHGETEGLVPEERRPIEYGPLLDSSELSEANFNYVAMGHYHVQKEIRPRVWYSGALDYVSPNPWGELAEERDLKLKGKGWLLVDLEKNTVTRKGIEPARRLIDLLPMDGLGRTAAELDRMVASALSGIKGGYRDQIVRQVIYNVPRQTEREMNHTAIRAAQAEALHLRLDLRRPEVRREIGVGSPGMRITLPERVEGYLRTRMLPADIDRPRLVEIGTALMRDLERELTDG
jgi:DNA repair exonuclease SbcCD nuclease subunit